MDDPAFDRELKNRLGEYEAPEFDPAALASFHHLAASASSPPWYSVYRTELVVGGSILFSTLLVISGLRIFLQNQTDVLQSELQRLNSRIEKVELRQQMPQQQSRVLSDTASATWINHEFRTMYLATLRHIDRLEAALSRALAKDDLSQHQHDQPATNDDAPPTSTTLFVPPGFDHRIQPRAYPSQSHRAQPNPYRLAGPGASKNLTPKTIRELQLHYQQGVGFRFAPTVAFSRASYSQGNGRYNFGIGILGDIILSPSWSLETGIVHTIRHYTLPYADRTQGEPLPGVESSLGAVKSTDVDSWIFETPLHFKYRYPISLKANWIAGIGYSHLFYTKQTLEHDYDFTSSPLASINTTYTTNKPRSYVGSVSISLGLSTVLRKNQILETSIYYQRGLTNTGIEQTRPDFIGMRAAYWFTLK